MVGERVLLKVSPMKGMMRFGRKGKLALRFIGQFGIIRFIGELAYEWALPPGLLGIHPVFHISMLKKYHSDGSYVIRWDSVILDQLYGLDTSILLVIQDLINGRVKEIGKLQDGLYYFLQYVKTQFSKTVKTVRSNNGTEFVNEFCSKLFLYLGIVHQISCAYTP
ncbi:uncharacterized protein LOC132613230 [Lycium barbarum]|uniref:uncharacterized protein LOC132613230 n=1 Tax=Lycium barbarum TaxID=112863 RepID=UPI00293E8918|nr:uncharacterized protein LOC132613230 [Lycium barbarum]